MSIIPTAPVRATMFLELVSPFHHGAGNAGNTSLLRTQDVLGVDGRVARVPFLSAASIRHALRDAIAWHIARTLQIEPGTLTKQAVDLLWTGGAVSSTGAKTDLEMIRRVEEHLPSLAMLGYAAQSDIIEGTLRASDFILVCAENYARLPETAAGCGPMKKAAAYRSEVFGTRHDQAAGPLARLIGDEEAPGTAQMIWDTQVLIPGAHLYGELSLTPAATYAHTVALGAALALWMDNGHVHIGAKTAQGMGHARVRNLTTDGFHDAGPEKDLEEFTQHLLDHECDILELLKDLGA